MKLYESYYRAKRNLLSDASLRTRIVGTLKPGSRVHISAVCGKAMASIACMLAEAGYKVTGSDYSFHPPMSGVLEAYHIVCTAPSVNNLQDIDLFVPGNMLPSSDVEVSYAREQGIPMMSGAEVSGVLLATEKRSLVVAGTHGKTTASSLLTHVFTVAGQDPAYLIGGVFQDSGKSFSRGSTNTKYAIFEGDEYDCAYFDKAPKFLRYSPTSTIITSVEHDHVDLYPTFEDYKQAFQFLVDDIPAGGNLIIHESALLHLDVLSCKGHTQIYGSGTVSDVMYEIVNTDQLGTTFSIQTKDKMYSGIRIPLFGEYNVANATAVFLLALTEGLALQSILDGLQTYPGVCERQEIIGTKENNIVVIRDFAHHPTAVEVTLQGLRMHYPDRRLVCVFEPRSITSRRKALEGVYPHALAHADVSIVVTPPFRPGDNASNFMDVDVIKKEMESMGKTVFTADVPQKALEILSEQIKENDVVVFMSNGDFEHIPQQFLER